MKNELKISTLSIVGVLCAAFAGSAYAAAPVRSLGGVGTYSSASNAAAAKTSGAKGSSAINAVRGGALRVNNSGSKVSAPATGSASTRVAASPRLSIGKYLSGSATLGSGAIKKPADNMDSDLSATNGQLQKRIADLEKHLGYAGDGNYDDDGRMEKVELDIQSLTADMNKLTSGMVEGVNYADGVLSVQYKGDEQPVVYDLTEYLATASELVVLEEKINAIVAGDVLADYALKSELAGLASGAELDSAVARLDIAETEIANANAEIKRLAQDLESMGDTVGAAQLAELSDRVLVLEQGMLTDSDITDLRSSVSTLVSESQNYATKTALQNLEASLSKYLTAADLADYALKSELTGLATKDELSGLALKSDLTSAEARLSAAELELTALKETLDAMGDVAGAEQLSELTKRIAALENSDKLAADDIIALKSAVQELQANADSYATKAALQNVQNALSGFVTIDTFNTEMAKKANAADVYSKGDVNALIQGVNNFDAEQYYDKTYINANLATKNEIPVVPENVSAFNNDAGYVTGDALTAVKTTADSAKSLADSNAEALLKLNDEYATDSELADVKKELSDEISAMTGGQNLGALAYKNTVSATEIENNSVTMDKINTTALKGGMAIVQNTADGTQLVPVVIIDKDGNPVL